VEASSESAAALLGNGHPAHVEPEPELVNGVPVPAPPLERIASLLEEIEARRQAETRRPT
jgi:hypothetical protein